VLERIARLAIRAPRRIIAVALFIVAGAAVFGLPVANSLSAGGFQDPTSESAHASQVLAGKFNQGDMQMLITVSSPDGAQSGPVRAVGTDIVRQLQGSPFVAQVTSAWTVPPAASRALVSKDGNTGLIVAGIIGGQNGAPKHAEALRDQVVHDRDGVSVRVGGEAMIATQINHQTQKDLKLMESIAIPLSFLVLVWVFGGLVAATLPLAVGGFAIFGSMAMLRAMSFATNVSIFALNLCVAMGMALAIDYTLLIVSRFRDELANGAGRDEALIHAMATAGRTVLFSAATVALSMSAMTVFPMYFLTSFAYAGIATVAFVAVAAVTVTPAVIALLGPRLDSLDVRRPVRLLLRRQQPVNRPVEQTFFYRLAKSVMRHAIPIGLAVVALLSALGIPFLSAKWGLPDDRVLPISASSRQVGDQLRTGFADDVASNLTVVIPDATGITPTELGRYAAQLSQVADVESVTAPVGTFVAGSRAGPPSAATAIRDGSAFLTITSRAPPYAQASQTQLDALRAVPGPAGRHALLTGTAAINRDTAHAVASRLPTALGIIAAITFVLLFVLTGSVVLPLKSLGLSVLSLTAAFGALVWIFQNGHLGALGTTATGTLVVTMPALLFCIAFGLSMDYEVILVSRIHEYWLASNHTAAANDESVALGVAHTGRVITAAALIMSISFAAMIAAQVSFMRMFGLGLTLAVLGDATLVRMLLVPAFMHIMGRFNWWSTRLLRWLHQRLPMSRPPVPRQRRQPKSRPTLAEPDDLGQAHRLAGHPLPHQS
jgi:putative drug exporter of the RND superfamily